MPLRVKASLLQILKSYLANGWSSITCSRACPIPKGHEKGHEAEKKRGGDVQQMIAVDWLLIRKSGRYPFSKTVESVLDFIDE